MDSADPQTQFVPASQSVADDLPHTRQELECVSSLGGNPKQNLGTFHPGRPPACEEAGVAETGGRSIGC